MKYLRIFDIQYSNFAFYNRREETSYRTLMNQFSTQFWFERQWFFGHQHNWLEYTNNAIFYSTNPYRNKFYSISNCSDNSICPYYAVNANTSIRFPNAMQFIIHRSLSFQNDELLMNNFNHLRHLTQVRKLTFNSSCLHSNELIMMLNLTPNCHILVLNTLSLTDQPIQFNSHQIRIENLLIKQLSSLKIWKFFFNLCPCLKHTTIRLSYCTSIPIINYMFIKNNYRTLPMFSLYLLKLGESTVRALVDLINSKNLSIECKAIDDNCYLWW
ncbi:hypothetical protein I4U23_023501 [Adineta vaga]|nr:hypothetical protein I4U23_023501 [Adineta vaga]